MSEGVRVTAIIAAGGRGDRVGGAVPKQFRVVGGRTLLELSLEPFDESSCVDNIVLVLPPDVADVPPLAVDNIATPLTVVSGGARRQDSVAAGFEHVASNTDVVVVHDAARPFCTIGLIERTIVAAAETGAAISALRASDTVKEGTTDGGITYVNATLPRQQIFLAQTPQAFRVGVLRDAVDLGRSGVEATDEATLAERAGHRVRLVDGDTRNIKITTPVDLSLAADIVAQRAVVGAPRVGLGYDCHRMVDGRPLVLGGVRIPCDRGLSGHSDADAVCHAITDAVLGGAGAGDIGQHFPDDDPQWKDASSIDLLGQAVSLIAARGYRVGNVDVVVVLERPKIRPHVAEMRQSLADVLQIEPQKISIKGKTAEGLDAVGRGEAVAVHAVAVLFA